VEQAIDRIITYYRKSEPSSPVPLILTRAKRLVGADFMTIVTDLAPGGKDNVKLVGGVEDE
jgi:type VI secretion system protein ImpA